MFKQAIANSPNKRVDIAVANAGIAGVDDIFKHNSISVLLKLNTRLTSEVEQEDPDEPNLKILNVNGVGVLYTTKLALHGREIPHLCILNSNKSAVFP